MPVTDQAVGVALDESADDFEDASFAAEGHGAEAQAGDEDSGITQQLILHNFDSSRERARMNAKK